MRCLFPFLCTLMLAGCGDDKAPRSEPHDPPVVPAKPVQPPAPPPATPVASKAQAGEGAAAILRHYYALIEAGDYEQAWRMRSADGAGLAAFSRNFERYRSYRATVGTPSLEAQADGWAYVEVPVQIFGTLRNGEPFGTAGSVTMRRMTGTRQVASGQQEWHIYTKD